MGWQNSQARGQWPSEEWKPSSPLSEWPRVALAAQTSASSHDDLGNWGQPRLLLIAWELPLSLQPLPVPWDSLPSSNNPLGTRVPHAGGAFCGHQGFRRFPATALWFSTRVIYFCFTCYKTLRFLKELIVTEMPHTDWWQLSVLQSMTASPKLVANRVAPCSALLTFMAWAVL